MNEKPPNTQQKKSNGHGHKNHMRLMAICCGLPVIGLIAIATFGIISPTLETLIFLICPIGMIGMMYMMHRNESHSKGGHACCSSTDKDEGKEDAPSHSDTKKSGTTSLNPTSSFKA